MTSWTFRIDPHRRLMLLMGALVMTAVLTGIAVLDYLEEDLIRRSGESLALEASHTADKLDRILFERYADLRMMTRAFRHETDDGEFLTRYLGWRQQTYPVYPWLGVTESSGRVIATTDPSTLRQDRSRETWFRTAKEGRIVVEDMRPHDELNGGMAMAFASPIRDDSGEFRGVVAAFVGLEILEELLQGAQQPLQAHLSPEAELEYTVLTADGEVIVGSLFGELGHLNVATLPSLGRVSSSAVPGYVEEESGWRRIPVVTGYARTNGYRGFQGIGWNILVTSPREAVLAPITRVIRLVAMAGLGGMAPLVTFLFLLTRRLRLSEGALRRAHAALEQRTATLLLKQEQLQSLTAELSRTETRERGRLATDLHDNLGQLLALANLNLSMLERDASPTRIHRVKELIDEALTYTRTLVTDLRPPLLGDEEDLSAAIAWVVKKMERLGLAVDLHDDGEPKPLAEELLTVTYQSVQELLVNVLKHSRTTTATVSLRRAGPFVEVVVQDEGIGFDVSARPSPSEKGGFGLFNIAERLSLLVGRFDLTSGVGKGTCASLLLPLKGVPDAPARPEPQRTSHSETMGVRSSDVASPIRVLLVDDHPLMREGLRRILDEQPDIAVVGEAWDGEVAVQAARRWQPDVIIMDVDMPKLNGVEAARRIVAQFPDMAVIVLSMHEDAKPAHAMRQAGAVAYLTKSEAPTLVSAIRSAHRSVKHPLPS